jgi:PEP-CTERM motif
MKKLILSLLVAVGLIGGAKAQLTITPTFDPALLSNGSYSEITNAVYSAIDQITNAITTQYADPVTIYIKDMNTGLGQANTRIYEGTYTQYTNYLMKNIANPTVIQSQAWSTLPETPGDALNNNTNITLTISEINAIGGPGADIIGTNYFSTLSFNFGIMNLSRTSGLVVGKYDALSTILHEVDEVLGIGGSGSTLGWDGRGDVPALPDSISPLDLFRYAGNGVRSFAYGTNQPAYFSIDGGIRNLVNFNQNPGGDYGDWGNGVSLGQGNTPPQVQDAYDSPYDGTNNYTADLGTNELTALQVIGYAPVQSVPEPSTYALFGLGAIGMLMVLRRKTAA